MDPRGGSDVRKTRRNVITTNSNVVAVAAQTPGPAQRPRPVRVRLRRINAEVSEHLPPTGQEKIWWNRLGKALGTTSSDFVNASLYQLQAAARLPQGGGISELAMNGALALVEAEAPRNETEAAIVMQLACAHGATMTMLGRIGQHCTARNSTAIASAAARLMRACAGHVETLRRLRNGGNQTIRIERVNISDGGQAVIGNVQANKSEGKAA
jgi:hypothetical protein